MLDKPSRTIGHMTKTATISSLPPIDWGEVEVSFDTGALANWIAQKHHHLSCLIQGTEAALETLRAEMATLLEGAELLRLGLAADYARLAAIAAEQHG
jgi:hypothetical protein